MERLGIALISISVILGLADIIFDFTGYAESGRILTWVLLALAVVGLAFYLVGRRTRQGERSR
jgi:hypothetical protein